MIISFSGYCKSGKSLICSLITDINPSFKVMSFADPLKEMYAKHKGIPLEELYDIQLKEKHRQELIAYADRLREKDPLIFVNKLKRRLRKSENILIEDTRSLFELEMLFKMGAKPYRVLASPHIRKQRGWIPNPMVDQHITETDLDLSAETFMALGGGVIDNNDNSLDNLNKKVFNFLLGLH